jgi:Protein of unknown function (DUF4058)
MPVHDWTRVDAGVFHDFHNAWITELRNALNSNLLPPGFYAMSEQHAGKYITDVLTLGTNSPAAGPISGGIAVAESPPKVRQALSLSSAARARRKTLAIRHASGDRLVALLELVSPANKDRSEHVKELLDKMEDALGHGIHLLLVDLFPASKHDPHGLHAALWDRLGDETDGPPPHEPLTLAAYVADIPVKAYLESLAIGGKLPDMPVFLDPDTYIYTPLEMTYQAAWRGSPARWRDVLDRPAISARRKRRR